MNKYLTPAWKVRGLSTLEKFILVRLADMADESGRCYPGQTFIANDCACTTRAVRDALKTLVDAGHLVIESPATFSRSARYLVTPKPENRDTPPEITSGPEPDSAEEPEVLPSGNHFRGDRNSLPSPPEITSANPSVTTKDPPNGTKSGQGFAEFWAAYPKKAKKHDAKKSWLKVKPAEIPALMASLTAFKSTHDWTKEGGRYIPTAPVWLNGRRWEDEIQHAQPHLPLNHATYKFT